MFEAALALSPAEDLLRGRVGDVLRERTELAEWFHRHERRKDLLQRLETYDDGTWGQWLQAPPLLSIRTSPPGADVLLERYEDDRKGYRKPVRVRALGKTPLESVELYEGPGSYRLTLQASGRTTVRYPLLLSRGERLSISIPHPLETAVPAGFVFIPPGRFLFGSADPEGMRRGIMKAPPLHELRLDHGYLIARTEVTFRDWIQFLESSQQARERFLPKADMHDWSMNLKQAPGGRWQLQLVRKGQRLVLAEGEPLELPERDRRQRQDWGRLPVSGIDFEAAQAHVTWLREERRVPGARICDEREWERAARGADDRLYPHGDHLGFEDASFDETYGRNPHAMGPDEVGSHPVSVSPFDVLDMTGNVYEWTRSMWASGETVIRGGAWYYDSVSVLTANRTVVEPKTRDMMVGLRVCADAPPE
jgi:formylglycine-generating enzyme required for sulfatase activity